MIWVHLLSPLYCLLWGVSLLARAVSERDATGTVLAVVAVAGCGLQVWLLMRPLKEEP